MSYIVQTCVMRRNA